MERELVSQIWPIFSAEAREHLAAISGGVLELEQDPTRAAVLDGFRRTAHSLKGSAGSLGLGDLERLAHAIEGALARFDPAAGLPRATVQAVLEAVQAIEAALGAGDAGGEPTVPALAALLSALGAGAPRAAAPGPARPSAPPAAAARGAPAPPALALLATLETACSELVRPLPAADRQARTAAAVEAARALAERAPGSAVPARLAEGFGRLAGEGPEVARAAAAIAGDLVELRALLEAAPGAGGEGSAEAAPAAAAQAHPQGPASAAPAEKSIRVLASTMESLTRQLELLSMGESRHRHRSLELREMEQSLRDGLHGLERAAQALRGERQDEARQELGPALGRLQSLAARMGRMVRDGLRDADAQRLSGTLLREDLRALRMVPASQALEPLRRTIREVSGRTGKEADLQLVGADVRLDRRVVDELRDPLLHLVRNAVDHGIEPPEARRRAGKPARGQVRVRVEPRGTRVGLVVEDDGAGLDVAAVRQAAVRRGAVTAEAAARLSDQEAVQLIFQTGLSTAAAVTEISGRGVGLDVVLDTARRLQGTVTVSHRPGQGTAFDVEVPVSLAASAALLIRVGREVAAVPGDAVARVLLLGEGDVGTVAGRATVRVGTAQLPYAPLSAVLGLNATAPESRSHLRPALVLASGGQRVVLGVEEVLGQQELVVSSLGARLAQVSHLAGAAVLDDGRVIGVLAAPELVRRVQPAAGASRGAAPARTRILVVDDSLTTRSAMKALLEIAGYAVAAAADGEEAFQLLATAGAELVVSDVQMPRLDGFGLTRRIKADPRLRATPVVLVTSLEAAEDRALGLEAGADGYLVKREVERGKLLELVRQLLPDRRPGA
jgi:two-component system, chemotaxis family, sensor kinase CheA